MSKDKKPEKTVKLKPTVIKAGKPTPKSPRRKQAESEVDKYFTKIRREM